MAAAVAKSCKATVWESEVYFELALHFQAVSMFDSALFFLRKSTETAPKNLGNYQKVIDSREASMAVSYLQLGQRAKALKLTAIREEKLNNEWLSGDSQMIELGDLITSYRMLGDLKKLVAAQRKLVLLNESVNSRERMISTGKVQGRLQLELKDKQLKVLEMSNELHAAAAKHELWLRFLLIGIVLVTVAGFVVVRILLTRQKKLNLFLTTQNEMIDQQKNDIEKSLQQLQRTQAHVLNSEKMAMLGQFTAGVAHELNNPLNFVSGGLSVLEETIEEAGTEFEKERDTLSAIRGGIDRAMAIVNSLRVFSNPRSGIGYDSYSDIAECMKASLLVMQSRITANEINVVSDLSEQLVVGHSGQLCQIFINIIDNAIHAVKDMPKERKRIHIRSRKHGPNVLIDFQDCGAGIPESVHANLFRPFFTTKPAGQGIGLGLFICNTILKTIDGAIAFESRADVGTTFSVQLARPK
ncbi:MAG TPA: ATP-binding protein [Cyclobacteriaceae bacterium]|nr:ATP-binding protein [Cyclobacteriaceae bacterium]